MRPLFVGTSKIRFRDEDMAPFPGSWLASRQHSGWRTILDVPEFCDYVAYNYRDRAVKLQQLKFDPIHAATTAATVVTFVAGVCKAVVTLSRACQLREADRNLRYSDC